MSAKSDFGRMSGAVKPLFVPLSLLFMRWLAQKGIWRRFCGKSQGKEEGGILDSRHFNDWELEEAQRFIGTVSTKNLSPLTVDRMWWNGAKDGMFSVKFGYDVLDAGWQNLVPVKMI